MITAGLCTAVVGVLGVALFPATAGGTAAARARITGSATVDREF